ncbi:alpha/beta fold hydrolase [Pendulispora albinea]|uniref:Alpha/beta hydrolase n=1 Tax=Pendulispora albinea TaxID=2741071 RepID=A0ABZ2M129_9BACT
MQEILVPSADGHRVRAFFSGRDAQKPTVTFVLPFGSKFDMARPFLTELAGPFNVVTWEARIIVDDPELHPDVDAITPQMHVADMISVLSRLEIPRTDVIGYCSGAGISLLAAHEHPDRFGRLALVSGEYVLPPSVCARTRFQNDLDELLVFAATSKAHTAAIFSKLTPREVPEGDTVLAGAALPFSRPEYLHRFAVNYISYRKMEFLRIAPEVEHRALVIVGERDEQVTVRSSELIQGKLRRSELRLDPVADHHDVCRAVTPINRAVVEFLSLEPS